MTTVPCGSCRACCIGERVVLSESEIAKFPWEEINGIKLLQHKPGSDECIYLTETGCSIHGNAPSICQKFDCRMYFLSLTRKERRVQEKHDKLHNYHNKTVVIEEGRKRLDTLTPQQRSLAMSQRRFEPKNVKRMKLYDYKMQLLRNKK